VNNAGVMYTGVTEAFDMEQVKAQFEINVFGTARINRAVIPYMRKRKSGLLIQISSLAGRAVFPFFGLYCASKYAAETLAESYRYELRGFGIDSVIIEPGPFKTSLFQNAPRPIDENRLGDYSELASFADRLLDGFENNGGEPEQVVETIRELIRMEKKRPLRTVVSGEDFGIGKLNETIDSFQAGLLEAMGI